MPVPFDQPLFIVLVLEPLEGSLQVLDARVRFQPEQIFLGKADESLGAAVAFFKSERMTAMSRFPTNGSRQRNE